MRYTEPALGWRETLAAAYVIDPAARVKRDEPALPHITSHNQALRVAKRMARLRRPTFTLQGSLGLAGYLLQGQRFVRIVHAGLGLDGVIEVGELAREESGLGFSLMGTAGAPEDFAFEAATEEPPRPLAARVASDDSIAPVTGLTGLAQPGAAILWSWDTTDRSLVQELRLRAAGSTGWEVVEGTAGATQLVTRGLVDGTAYEAQVRNRTAARRVSAWAPEPPVPVTAIADSAPPGALPGFTATVAGADVLVGWTAPGDPRYFATRLHRASYPAGHAGAPSYRLDSGADTDAPDSPLAGKRVVIATQGAGTSRVRVNAGAWATAANPAALLDQFVIGNSRAAATATGLQGGVRAVSLFAADLAQAPDDLAVVQGWHDLV